MKRGLVFGGGGAKGAYEIGVWKALDELDLTFDMLAGTSIGSLNATLYVQDQYEVAEDLWLNISPSLVISNGVNIDFDYQLLVSQKDKYLPFIKSAIKNRSLDISPLYDMLKKGVDYERLSASKMELFAVCVEVPSFTPCEVDLKSEELELVAEYLMASSACFPIFPIHKINDKYYIDGGYYDNVPYKTLIKNGATSVFAVSLESPALTCRDNIDGVEVTILKSYWSLGGFLNFSPESAKRNMRLGYLDTMKLHNKYQGYAYTFFNNQEILKSITTKFLEVYQELNIKKKKKTNIQFNVGKKDEELILSRLKDLTSENKVLRLIEKLMEIADYSPINIYNLEEVIKDLMSIYGSITTVNLKEWMKTFVKDPKETVANINVKTRIMIITKLIQEKDTDSFHVVCKIINDECLLAVLIYSLLKEL